MMDELGFALKLEKALGKFETELHEIYHGQEDIFSNEHLQMRELLKVIIETRKKVNRISGKLLPPDEFDIFKR
ncbi:hypothetical protein NLU03_24950 [Bacillus toyonensis]|nr:hypothetical protein [Bacillus toyonensis]